MKVEFTNNKELARGLDELLESALSRWTFDKYKSEKVVREEETIYILEEQKEEYFRLNALLEGISFAKELTIEPANRLYPQVFAERLLALRELGVEVELLDARSMPCLEAVGQGSGRAPYAVAMTWKGCLAKDRPTLVVGKGVCFDSGGLCIKKPEIQRMMMWDKAGAAAVAGLMKALSLSNSPAYVVGIVGLVENMPDGKAIRPGDVIDSLSGQTIEIVDTDAEGRLVLADLLYYGISRYSPELVIDLGTLTPEVFATLGSAYAGLYTDDEDLASMLIKAGKQAKEPLWRLPMGESFAKQIVSSIADIKNLGDEFYGESGACAEFLRCFVERDVPWAHIDIAGVSWTKESPSKVTGFGVRLLDAFLANHVAKKQVVSYV